MYSSVLLTMMVRRAGNSDLVFFGNCRLPFHSGDVF